MKKNITEKKLDSNQEINTVFARQISSPLTRAEQDQVSGGQTRCSTSYNAGGQAIDYECKEV